MFIASAAPESPPAAAETWRINSPENLASDTEVEPTAFSKFVINRNYLALEGGRLLLKLHKRPVLEVNPLTLECEVMGWGIKLSYVQAGEVDRVMARRFSLLFSKSDADELTAEDKKLWLSILDQVDFTSFCINRAAPHYVEGQLRRLRPDCYVDWSDGRSEKIAPHVATAFSELEVGDSFGAHIKLGHDSKALSVERVTMLTSA